MNTQSLFKAGYFGEWRIWMMAAVVVLMSQDVFGPLTFPLRLVLLRIEIFLAEGIWIRHHREVNQIREESLC